MSRIKEGGVEFYAEGRAVVSVWFPNGELKCRSCRFCLKDGGVDGRYHCLLDPTLYMAGIYIDTIREGCPLEFAEASDC